jgi:alpha-L-fucosidase
LTIADLIAGSEISKAYVDYVESHWLELIDRYDPCILWGDIGYPPGYDLPALFAHFYNRHPEGVINDRWMQLPIFFYNRVGRMLLTQVIKRAASGESPKVPHCDFVTPEYATLDHISEQKWETCRGIGNSFGYNQFEDDSDYQKAPDLIRLLADVVSKNGNLLLNVGPCPDGSIHPDQVQAIRGMGDWLELNGDAIYSTRSWQRYKDSDSKGNEVRYTTKDGFLYAIIVHLSEDKVLTLPLDISTKVLLLENGERLPAERRDQSLVIRLPDHIQAEAIPVIKIQEY